MLYSIAADLSTTETCKGFGRGRERGWVEILITWRDFG